MAFNFISFIGAKKNAVSRSEGSKEKSKDFRNIVLIQIVIIVSALLLKESLFMMGIDEQTSKIERDSIFLLFGGIYVLILWDLLRNFTRHNWLVMLLFGLIMGTYVYALVVVNPIFPYFDTDAEKRPSLFFIHLVLFLVEATVIYHAILDIFSGNKLSKEKLWGSACIFLMIGISFGSLYDLINIAYPGSIGKNIPMGLESYTTCIYYSMCTIGGRDSFLQTSALIQNISVIEAVWSNLFIVLLVGRLLGQPDAEQPVL